jgi:fructoselysine-6-P-deglycase FrlB-like protein
MTFLSALKEIKHNTWDENKHKENQPMMQNKMQSCINQQQAVMGSVLAGAQRNTAGFVERYSEKKISRIILVGAGSSFHSMNMARPFCHEVMKVPVFAATPAQLDWLNVDYTADTLVIAASQSGTSSNTLSLVQRLKKQGFDVSAITQDSASYIAKAVDCHVLLDIPAEPAGPKTMGVLGTILTTQMLLAQLALAKGRMPLSAYEGFLADIRRACSYLSENIEMAKSWLEKNKGDDDTYTVHLVS